MSNPKKTSSHPTRLPLRKLSEGTLIFFPKSGTDQTAGLIVNEPTGHFTRNSLEAFYVYDVFVASHHSVDYGTVMAVASTAIGESFEA
jgi:hypothetical protein